MKMFAEDRKASGMRGGFHMMNEHRGPERHMPPHERKALIVTMAWKEVGGTTQQ